MELTRKLLFVIIIFAGCKDSIKSKQYSFPRNIAISNSIGVPASKQSFFFPFNKQFKTQNSCTDTLENRVNSTILFSANERILYNYYLNQDRFRLLIMESWRPIKIINFIKESDEILVETKTLSIHSFIPEVQRQSNNITLDLDGRVDSICYSLVKRKLSINWKEFNHRIEGSNFWEMGNTSEVNGQDGTRIVLEGHSKDGYWFVNRWQPGLTLTGTDVKEGLLFKRVCDYMAKLAGEKINW